eukprot:TRINITY_DN1226_c0_g1_i1.p1 TRINITY_DN1226_c0_g1~~TRINITY_DN1226_c0_g1_i1.p1  ORF type:complete len:584 (-),score=49.45 TRINITY_DN1226_c0_g1_i1:381-2132(-)
MIELSNQYSYGLQRKSSICQFIRFKILNSISTPRRKTTLPISYSQSQGSIFQLQQQQQQKQFQLQYQDTQSAPNQIDNFNNFKNVRNYQQNQLKVDLGVSCPEDFSRLMNNFKQLEKEKQLHLLSIPQITFLMSQLGEYLIQNKRNRRKIFNEDEIVQIYTYLNTIFLDSYGVIYQLNNNQISECLWSFAIGVKLWNIQNHVQYFDKVYQQLVEQSLKMLKKQKLKKFNGYQITNLIWSFANIFPTMKISVSAFEQFIKIAQEYNPKQISPDAIIAIFESIAIFKDLSYQFQKQPFFQIAIDLIYQFDEKQILKLILATKNIRYNDSNFMNKFENQVIKKQWSFKLEKMTEVFSVFAEFGVINDEVFRVFIQDIFVMKYQGQNIQKLRLGEMLRNLAMAHAPVQLCMQLIRTVKRYNSNFQNDLDQSQLAYLQQAEFIFKSQKQDLLLSDRVKKVASEALKFQNQKESLKFTKFQNEVFNELKQNILHLKKGMLRADNQFRIHISVVNITKKTKAAILPMGEEDYYSYFNYLQMDKKMMGSRASFVKVLESFGWKVIVVREEDWGQEGYAYEISKQVYQILQG